MNNELKNLQDYLDRMSLEELNKLSVITEGHNLQKTLPDVLYLIKTVYRSETGSETDINDMPVGEIEKLFNDFVFAVNLYINVRLGFMEIVSGKIQLTNTHSCKLRMTDRGRNKSERIINPPQP